MKRKGLLAPRGGQTHRRRLPIKGVGMQVVTRRARRRGWTACFTAVLFSGDGGPDGFGCLLSGLDMQVGHELWMRALAISIGEFVEIEGVAVSQAPALVADSIEGSRKLRGRFGKCLSLFAIWFEPQPDCSVHEDISIPLRSVYLHPFPRGYHGFRSDMRVQWNLTKGRRFPVSPKGDSPRVLFFMVRA